MKSKKLISNAMCWPEAIQDRATNFYENNLPSHLNVLLSKNLK